MKLTPIEDRKAGDTTRAVLFAIEEAEDKGYGPGLKWLLKDIDTNQTIVVYSGQTATPRSKLGKFIINLTGKLQEVDTDELVGATVMVHWDNHKSDATKVVVSNLTTRPAAKGEDVGKILEDALAAEAARDLEAPF